MNGLAFLTLRLLRQGKTTLEGDRHVGTAGLGATLDPLVGDVNEHRGRVAVPDFSLPSNLLEEMPARPEVVDDRAREAILDLDAARRALGVAGIVADEESRRLDRALH